MSRSGLASLLAFVSASLAARELPVETFFRNYQHAEARISPDGTCIGVLAPVENRVGLAIVDLQKSTANWAFSDRTADVEWFEWANTNRLVFGLGDDGYLRSGLLAVNKDSSRPVTLVFVGDYRTSLLATLPDSPNEVLVNSLVHSTPPPDTLLRFPNVERMNLFTGGTSTVVRNPGKVFRWITDHHGVVRIGIAKEETSFKILYRDQANVPWVVLATFNWNDDASFNPEGFESDDRTLLVKATGDGDTEALYTYDLTAKKFKDLAFRHAEVDLGHLIFSQKHALLGVTCQAERPEIYWFEPRYREMQARIDNTLTNTVNLLVNTGHNGTKALFKAMSDRTPGTYYLMDTESLKLQKLFDVADWIDPEGMAEMKPIEYKARDGLRIHGYLTVPKGCSGKHLPMIVNPHGGPTTRDTWGFDR